MEPSSFSGFHSNGDAQRPQRPRLEEGQLLNYYPNHEDHQQTSPNHQLDRPLPASSLTAPSIYYTYSDTSERIDARWSEHAASSSSRGIFRTEFGSGSTLPSNNLQQLGFPVVSSTSTPPISSSNHRTFGYTNNGSNYVHCNEPHFFPSSISSPANGAEYSHTSPGRSTVAPGPFIPDVTSYRSPIAGPFAPPLYTNPRYASSYSSTPMSTSFGDNGIPVTRSMSTNNGGDWSISLLYPDHSLMNEETMRMMGMTDSQLTSLITSSAPISTEMTDTMDLVSPGGIASVDVDFYPTSASTSTATSMPFVSSGRSGVSLPLLHPPVVQPQLQPPLYDPRYLQPLHHQYQHHHHHHNSNSTFPHVPYDPEQSLEHEDMVHDDYELQDDEYEPGQETSTTDESSRSGVLTRKSYPCRYCPQVYSRLSRQEACINRHNNVKPYLCEGACGTENCPMTFHGVENLNRHRRLKNKKWVCPDCHQPSHPSNKERHKRRCPSKRNSTAPSIVDDRLLH
ncbi:hypothetical protein FRC14_006735 [Serendipita sp. 396]|nr:hypothetical protein FRC14_006735 [Serendipita sp. 396]KAG8778563.1 hypothetical protein FRC15_010730 [Serendipita sp. 397]KAG8795505.1 hypothetical protein FRC16_010052 [Serendipita sp. 398]KAG8813522.1 hypothetical protein FRC19_002376 [Serendipita sp. 401]KAG8863869.1 hypothetical protein FRC20_010521 [Serendipita sp. 405]KAG9048940.1 hypothetical protein FS842_000276 [Serendipita sp. 407]